MLYFLSAWNTLRPQLQRAAKFFHVIISPIEDYLRLAVRIRVPHCYFTYLLSFNSTQKQSYQVKEERGLERLIFRKTDHLCFHLPHFLDSP